jgi:glutaminyl-tRNA synthetase
MTTRRANFLTEIIDADLAAGRATRIATRFPPEPNGYLHVGHAKSICLNFGLARDYAGTCNLRMDDTNPVKEDIDYVHSIQKDVAWLGFTWAGEVRFASDYFDHMYALAEVLIQQGDAYVDHQNVEEIRLNRGDFNRVGADSPFRTRSVEENLALFRSMRAGELVDGTCVLRAKIDMSHPNVLMRDPLLYRIRHAHHHRTGDKWCIYPMYDYAHPLEDALEGITHSICTLEFESNRELYDWVLDHTRHPEGQAWNPRPHQYEFARLGLGYTVMSKRKLLQLVEDKRVNGWDDPRMPTIAGMRRRGVTPDALRDFADLIGVAKNNSLVDIGKLEFCVRQDLEKRAPRAMAVLQPLSLQLTNWPLGTTDLLTIPWKTGEPGTRQVPFGREILIEREDFSEDPPADWKRLSVGKEVRLFGAYFVRCDEVVRDDGEIVGLRGTVDLQSRGGEAKDGRQPVGTLHWVDATHAVDCEFRLYDRLFTVEQPDADGDFLPHMNPDALQVLQGQMEPAAASLPPESHLQLMRIGYFFSDPVDVDPEKPVWNRVIGLRDTWAKAPGRADGRPDRKKEPEAKKEVANRDGGSKDLSAQKKNRAEWRAEKRAATPELAAAHGRYGALGLDPDSADLLTDEVDTVGFFDAALRAHPHPQSLARWFLNDLEGLRKGRPVAEIPFDGATFGHFVALLDGGRVTMAAGKQLLAHLAAHGGEPVALIAELGLGKVDDSAAVMAAIDSALAGMPSEVERFRAGEQKLLGVFIGAVLKQMRGSADAGAVRQGLLERLKG